MLSYPVGTLLFIRKIISTHSFEMASLVLVAKKRFCEVCMSIDKRKLKDQSNNGVPDFTNQKNLKIFCGSFSRFPSISECDPLRPDKSVSKSVETMKVDGTNHS